MIFKNYLSIIDVDVTLVQYFLLKTHFLGLTNTGQNVTISIIFKKSLFIIKYTFSQFQNDNDVRHEFSDLTHKSVKSRVRHSVS